MLCEGVFDRYCTYLNLVKAFLKLVSGHQKHSDRGFHSGLKFYDQIGNKSCQIFGLLDGLRGESSSMKNMKKKKI
jgi:hypothetical protein